MLRRGEAADFPRHWVGGERKEVAGAHVAARVDDIERSAMEDVRRRAFDSDVVRTPDGSKLLLRAEEPVPLSTPARSGRERSHAPDRIRPGIDAYDEENGAGPRRLPLEVRKRPSLDGTLAPAT